MTLPGDRVSVRITGERSGGFKGEAVELLAEGGARVEPPCPHFGPCGGCALQHFEDTAYADWKAALLPQALARRGLQAERLHPMLRVPPGRRRRVVLSAERKGGAVLLGYHERESHRLVDIHDCLLLTPALTALIAPLRGLLDGVLDPREEARVTALDSETGLDVLIESRHRLDMEDRERLADFAAGADLARLSWSAGREEAEPVALRRSPVLTFGATAVVPPPGGFVQPTAEGQQALVERVLAAIPATAETAADLFAGCGTFTFPLAERLQVYAAEGSEAAVAALSAAARQDARGARITAEQRDLARFPVQADELSGGDVVVFDPPRTGAREQVRALAQSDVPLVIAVSCNPTTFARDARSLVDGGYRLTEATPIDQFPWSGHLELEAVGEHRLHPGFRQSADVGVAEARVFQHGADEVGAAQIAAREGGVAQIGVGEVAGGEDRAVEVDPLEICIGEGDGRQAAAGEIDFGEVLLGEVRPLALLAVAVHPALVVGKGLDQGDRINGLHGCRKQAGKLHAGIFEGCAAQIGLLQPRVGEHHTLQFGAGEAAAAQIGAVKLRPVEHCTCKVDVLQHGVAQVRVAEVGVAERGADFPEHLLIALCAVGDDAAAAQIGLVETRVPQVGLVEDHGAQIGPFEIGPGEIRRLEGRAEKLRPAEVGIGQIGARKQAGHEVRLGEAEPADVEFHQDAVAHDDPPPVALFIDEALMNLGQLDQGFLGDDTPAENDVFAVAAFAIARHG
ncbi:unnamed protein product [Symbiodinium sp. CCMP2456]|nr:unnamed protein product [Symbiodinium sp. CCMP2456]